MSPEVAGLLSKGRAYIEQCPFTPYKVCTYYLMLPADAFKPFVVGLNAKQCEQDALYLHSLVQRKHDRFK